MSESTASPSGEGGAVKARGRWAPMPFIALGVSLIIMDATIVNVAIPTIVRSLHLDATEAEWINSVYPLAFAALLIVLGGLGDRYGRRRLFLAGLVVFGAGSLVAATAGSGGMLIAGRLLQGVGGAMILPATLATVNATYTGQDRNIAFAIWGSTIGGMAAVGPFVGGWLTTDVSWRWAFLLNVPVILVVAVGTIRFVPETTDPHARRGVDAVGVLASIVGLGGLVFGLIEGERYGWWRASPAAAIGGWRWPFTTSPIPIAFVLSAAALGTLLRVEVVRRRAGRPVLLDLSLFRLRSFRYGSIAALIVALGEFGLLFVLPLFLQGALGYSALRTGTLLLALAFGTFLMSGVSPQLTRRRGARTTVVVGLAMEAAAVAGLGASVRLGLGAAELAGWLFLYGAGVGFATAQLTSVILADVPVRQGGQASGMQSTVRQVGSALGIALLGTMFVVLLGAGTRDRLAAVPGLSDAARSALSESVRESAGAAIPQLSAAPGGQLAGPAAAAAMVDVVRTVCLIAAGVLLLGLAATLALARTRRAPAAEAVAAGAANAGP